MKTRILEIITFIMLLGVSNVFSQDTSTVPIGGLKEPYDVVVDVDTDLYYFTDSANGRVVLWDPEQQLMSDLQSGFLGSPQGIALGRGGLIVAETGSHRITTVSFGGDLEVIAGGTAGFNDGNGAGAEFRFPIGIDVDDLGNIWVTDSKNNAIRRIAPDNEVTTLVVVGADPVLFEPSALIIDSNGKIIITEPRSGLIRRINPADGAIEATVGGFSSRGLFEVGGDTGILFSDTLNHVIRRLDPVSFRSSLYAGVLGVAGNTDGNRFAATFNSPTGLARDFSGAILVADLHNNLLRRIDQRDSKDPEVEPEGAFFNNSIALTISTTTPRTLFKYTTDGTEPRSDAAEIQPELGGDDVLSGTFLLDKSGEKGAPLTFAVRAFSPDFKTSIVITNDYSFFVDKLNINLNGGSFTNDIDLKITTATTNAVMRFTRDGSDPTEESELWQDGLFGNNGALKIRGYRDGFRGSEIFSADFEFIVAQPLISFPNGQSTNNTFIANLASDTVGATLFYTTDESNPGTSDTRLEYDEDAGITISVNSKLRSVATKENYLDSASVEQQFDFGVASPSIQPNGQASFNAIEVTLATSTGEVDLYWTLDGSEPTTDDILYDSPFTLVQSGTMKVKGFKRGLTVSEFNPSEMIEAVFELTVANPVINVTSDVVDNVGENFITFTFSDDTNQATILYTLDGSNPDLVANPDNTEEYDGNEVQVSRNFDLAVQATREGFTASEIVNQSFLVKVVEPVMSPDSGFFPDGINVTLTISNPDARIYYTLDGSDPSEESFLYDDTPIEIDQITFPGTDLRALAARAFMEDAEPSDIIRGQPAAENSIGISRDSQGGIGSTIVVPLITNLRDSDVDQLLTFQLIIEIDPVGAAPPISSQFRVLGSDNFFFPNGVPVSSEYRSDGTTGRLVISFFRRDETDVQPIQDFGVIAKIGIPIPPTASIGDSYTIKVVEPSATFQGSEGGVQLIPLPDRTIVVASNPYLVGDVARSFFAPDGGGDIRGAKWYNAGDFGDTGGLLDASDANLVFKVSLGILEPYSFSDIFDAMDSYPPDDPDFVGGDGQIRFLDWQTILSRSLKLDDANWLRSWGNTGFRESTPFTFADPGNLNLPAENEDILPGMVWVSQVSMRAGTIDRVTPNQLIRVPVTLSIKDSNRISGMQFRAIVHSEDDAPPISGPIQFVVSEGIPQPVSLAGLPVNEVAVGWNLGTLNPELEGEVEIGFIQFRTPFNAKEGHRYSIRFSHADGSPDLSRQLDFETFPGSLWVDVPASDTAAIISDEWKNHFLKDVELEFQENDSDPDQDGFSNVSEYLAGTDPTDALSRLHLEPISVESIDSNGMLQLKWLTAPGKSYVIEATRRLDGGDWQIVNEDVEGTGDYIEITTDLESEYQYYRLRLIHP